MRIVVEKINSEPSHSITKDDVKIILGIIPKEWIGVAHVFKISAQMFDNSKWDRYVIQNSTTFNILSRGIEKELIIKDLLIEISLFPNRIYPKYAHKLSIEHRKKAEIIIQPFFDKFMKKNVAINQTK